MSLQFSEDRLDTDNPFIDLLLYSMKVIAANCVIKDQYSADAAETISSLNESALYISCKERNADLTMFDQIPDEILKAVNLHTKEPEAYNAYKKSNGKLSYIPKDYKRDGDPSGTTYRKDLTERMMDWYIEKYEYDNYSGESNEYYRKIMGLPPINDWGIDLIEYKYLIPDSENFVDDWTLSLHEIGYEKCLTLEQYGILDIIRLDYPDAKYLNYVTYGINPYDARKKFDFQILFTPRSIDISYQNTEISQEIFMAFLEEFINKYNKNREFMQTAVYSQAMEVDSELYHGFMVVYTLLITILDIINEVQTHIIKMDILNRRCIEYIFSIYLVPYFSQVPEKYQKKICRAVHSVIKYKSCTQEMLNFKTIFGKESIQIYKYYLVKDRLVDAMGDFIFNYSEKTICEYNDIVLLETRKETIANPPPAQSVPTDLSVYNIYAKTDEESQYNDKISSTVYKGNITSGYTDRYIVWPFPYFLQKGNVMFVRVDDYILEEGKDYDIYNYNRIRIKSSLLTGHTNITYEFYYDKTTIGENFKIDKEHALTMKTKIYTDLITNKIDLSPIPWTNYWYNENQVIVILDSVWLTTDMYTIDTDTNILTIDPSLKYRGCEVEVIFLHSGYINSRYKKGIVKATSEGQNTFKIPDPFPFYTLNENNFFITMGTIFVNPSRYQIYRAAEAGESYIKFTDGTTVTKGRELEFNFIYSQKSIINKIDLKTSTMTITVEEKYQKEFKLTLPVEHYATSGYLIFVEMFGWYLPRNAYSFTDHRLTILEESTALNPGDKLNLTLVYVNEDRTVKKDDNIKITKDYVVADTDKQKVFSVSFPVKNFNTKYNKIIVDVNGYYLSSDKYTVDYSKNTVTIKNYDHRPMSGQRVNYTFFYNIDAEYTAEFAIQEIYVDPANQNEFGLNYPFFPYLQTGHDFIVISGSTVVSKRRIHMRDQFIFTIDGTKDFIQKGKKLLILYIYNNYYIKNGNNKLIVEWVPKKVPTDIMLDNEYIPVPSPFEQYVQNDWPYFVSYKNRTFMHENVYDVYDEMFYTYPTKDLRNKIYGDTITFTFIYLLKEPWVKTELSEDYDKDLKLQFCSIPIDDLYSTVYLRDKTKYYSYESLTTDDGWWEGEKYKADYTDTLRHMIQREKFNYARSKYYGVVQHIDANEYAAIMGYFYSMLYDNKLLENKVCITIPSISSTEAFRLADIFIFMTELAFVYAKQESFIIDWDGPSVSKYAVGFNFSTSLTKMKEYLRDNHVDNKLYDIWDMIIPTTQIPSLERFMEIYYKDMEVKDRIIFNKLDSDSYAQYKHWRYFDDSLLRWKLDMSFFKKKDGNKAITYSEFLESWSPTLYKQLETLKAIKDDNNRTDAIVAVVDDIVYILKEFIDSETLAVLVDRFPGQSVLEAIRLMMLFLNFYKSYKIQFLSGAMQEMDFGGKKPTDDNTWRAIDELINQEVKYHREYHQLVEDLGGLNKSKEQTEQIKDFRSNEDFVMREDFVIEEIK